MTQRLTPSALLVSTVLALVLAGCARDQGAIRHANHAAPHPTDVQFEQAGDPPITFRTRLAAAQFCEAQENIPAAIDNYEAALQLRPGFSPALYRLGILYTRSRQFDRAIAVWHRYLQATDHAPEGYANLGFTLELAGRLAEAEQTYAKGIERDPGNTAVRTNYGLMLARRGQTEAAMEQWAVVLTPAESHYNLGSVYEQQGNTSAARSEYERALALDPQLTAASTRLNELR